jgi:hypothetical protein
VPPSFGPPQEDLRICVETPEGEQEPHGNRASEHTYIAIANIIVHCSMASLRNGVKNRAGNFAIEVAYGSSSTKSSNSAYELMSASTPKATKIARRRNMSRWANSGLMQCVLFDHLFGAGPGFAGS